MEIGIIKLALLAGGRGTRLGKLTDRIPKSMVKIDGRPFIAYQLDLLRKKGITDIVLCIGRFREQIEDYVGNGSKFGLNVEYSYDVTFSGTGGAIQGALPVLGDTFWVMYGDSYLDIDFSPILEYFLKYSFNPEYAGLMTVIKSSSYAGGNVIFRNKIVTYPRTLLDGNYIDYGLSIFRKNVFSDNVMSSVLRYGLKKLLGEGRSHKILGYEIKEMFYEIGSVEGLLETSNYIKDNKRGIV